MAFFRLLPFFVAATLLQETLVLGYGEDRILCVCVFLHLHNEQVG